VVVLVEPEPGFVTEPTEPAKLWERTTTTT
jgi:hypothetical protein